MVFRSLLPGAGTLIARHAATDNCVWESWMVGPTCRPKSAVKKAAMAGHDSYYEAVKHEKGEWKEDPIGRAGNQGG